MTATTQTVRPRPDIRRGVKVEPFEQTSGRYWIIYTRHWARLSDETLLADARKRGAIEDQYHSSHPGGKFTGQPRVRRSRSRVLITQFVGLDV